MTTTQDADPGRYTGPADDPRATATSFFHGSARQFTPGEVIVPASVHRQGVVHPHMGSPACAYAVTSEASAWHWAEFAWNAAETGRPRVYAVAPVGDWEPDDEFDAGDDAVMSPDGWVVLAELDPPDAYGGPDSDWA